MQDTPEEVVSLSEFLTSKMSVASTTSDGDLLVRPVNNLNEPELRTVLQHIAVVHPEVAQAALRHVHQQYDDVHSVMTEQASNKKKDDVPPPIRGTSHAHPSKRGAADADEGPPPQSARSQQRSQRQEQRPSMPPPVPKRRSVSPPPKPLANGNKQISSVSEASDDDEVTVVEPTSSAGACFLVYDARNSRMMVRYSRNLTAPPPEGALGMWTPEHPQRIREIKFVENGGKHELIGNCSPSAQGRRNYYSGVCLFVRLARVVNGTVTMFPINTTAIDFDIYLYHSQYAECNSVKATGSIDTKELDAIACLPKNSKFYRDRKVNLVKWMGAAAELGSATRFSRSSKAPNHRLSPPQPPQAQANSPALKRPTRKSSATLPDAP